MPDRKSAPLVPRGQGAQPLYHVQLELWRGDDARQVVAANRLADDRTGAENATVGRIVFNSPSMAGRFSQRAPAGFPRTAFVGGLTLADYQPLLQSAAART